MCRPVGAINLTRIINRKCCEAQQKREKKKKTECIIYCLHCDERKEEAEQEDNNRRGRKSCRLKIGKKETLKERKLEDSWPVNYSEGNENEKECVTTQNKRAKIKISSKKVNKE